MGDEALGEPGRASTREGIRLMESHEAIDGLPRGDRDGELRYCADVVVFPELEPSTAVRATFTREMSSALGMLFDQFSLLQAGLSTRELARKAICKQVKAQI